MRETQLIKEDIDADRNGIEKQKKMKLKKAKPIRDRELNQH